MEKTLIIAEAGVNHNGDIDIARRLIDAAAFAGADFVKFQTFRTEQLVSKTAGLADYQKRNTGAETSQYDMLKRLELSEAAHYQLRDHCRKAGIRFLSTAFDLESLDLLEGLGIELFKVPSGEITNLPYLVKVASYRKPVIMSSGMSTQEELTQAVDVLINGGVKREELTILHCTTEYPAPFADVNLRAMATIRQLFGVSVGYSDHTHGIEIPVAAVALGATVIEKHFTLDRTMQGPDHRASLEPAELAQMVTAIRNTELAMGSSKKEPTPSEIKNRSIARKSIHLGCALKGGHVIEEADLVMKRPGTGISPMELPRIIGKKLLRDMEAGAILKNEDLA